MENNFKHTPGKWVFESDDMNIYGPIGQGICTVHRRAKIVGVDDLSRPGKSFETIANAKLIATAPELLEALILIVSQIKPTDSGGYYFNEIHKAEQAIKKATE